MPHFRLACSEVRRCAGAAVLRARCASMARSVTLKQAQTCWPPDTTAIALGIHNDQVRLQLGNALSQKDVGRQAGDQVEAVFQQPDAQAARAIGLANGLRIIRISDVQIRRDNNDTKAWIHASKRCKNQATVNGVEPLLRAVSQQFLHIENPDVAPVDGDELLGFELMQDARESTPG